MNFDVDIDFADRTKALAGMDYIPAMVRDKNSNMTRHPSGVYFQDIPLNPLTDLCSFDYQKAEQLGYFKVDFLNVGVYQDVTSEQHLDDLLNSEPLWELLDEPGMVEQLTHISGHFGIVQMIKPRSIIDLAVVLALIRPGKKHLLRKSRAEIDAEIWKTDGNDGSYQFKRAHAVSYAALIVVQMNLIVESLMADDDGISL